MQKLPKRVQYPTSNDIVRSYSRRLGESDLKNDTLIKDLHLMKSPLKVLVACSTCPSCVMKECFANTRLSPQALDEANTYRLTCTILCFVLVLSKQKPKQNFFCFAMVF